MARRKVTAAPVLSDWAAVDQALRDIRECQHALTELAVDRDRRLDSIKNEYAKTALPLQNRIKRLESDVKDYRAPFTADDHVRLANVLHNIKGRFLLSYNDCPLVHDLYRDCRIEPLIRLNQLSATGPTEYKELLVCNYL